MCVVRQTLGCIDLCNDPKVATASNSSATLLPCSYPLQQCPAHIPFQSYMSKLNTDTHRIHTPPPTHTHTLKSFLEKPYLMLLRLACSPRMRTQGELLSQVPSGTLEARGVWKIETEAGSMLATEEAAFSVGRESRVRRTKRVRLEDSIGSE